MVLYAEELLTNSRDNSKHDRLHGSELIEDLCQIQELINKHLTDTALSHLDHKKFKEAIKSRKKENK